MKIKKILRAISVLSALGLSSGIAACDAAPDDIDDVADTEFRGSHKKIKKNTGARQFHLEDSVRFDGTAPGGRRGPWSGGVWAGGRWRQRRSHRGPVRG